MCSICFICFAFQCKCTYQSEKFTTILDVLYVLYVLHFSVNEPINQKGLRQSFTLKCKTHKTYRTIWFSKRFIGVTKSNMASLGISMARNSITYLG